MSVSSSKSLCGLLTAPPRLFSRNGFTLLEILIAVVLLAILTTALYASYFTVFKARERAAEGMETRRELGATLDLLRREIAATIYDDKDPMKRQRFVVEDRDNFGTPSSRLELTTLSPPSDQTNLESGISAVRYEILEKDKQRILTRKELDLFQDFATAKPYPQMERISGFLVECYDGSKWVRSWDTALNYKLPNSVRITVQFEEDGKPAEFSVLSVPRVSR